MPWQGSTLVRKSRIRRIKTRVLEEIGAQEWRHEFDWMNWGRRYATWLGISPREEHVEIH
jgi:hypothetical protein